MNDAAFYTPAELAKLWRCTPETVIAHVKAGRLRAFTLSKPGSRRPRWRIPHDAIAEFEERQSAKPPVKQPARRGKRQKRGDVIQFFKHGKRVI